MKEDSLICLFLLRLHLGIFCINSWTTHRCRGTQTVSVFSLWPDFVFSTLQSINKPRQKPPPEQSRSRCHCLRTTYTHTHTHALIYTQHVNTHMRACDHASHVRFCELPTARESTAWGPHSVFFIMFPASHAWYSMVRIFSLFSACVFMTGRLQTIIPLQQTTWHYFAVRPKRHRLVIYIRSSKARLLVETDGCCDVRNAAGNVELVPPDVPTRDCKKQIANGQLLFSFHSRTS